MTTGLSGRRIVRVVGRRLGPWSRVAIVACLLGALGASVALASPPGSYRLVNTHKLSSVKALGKVPPNCPSSIANACVEGGAYGTVSFSPHILKPGGVLTARVRPSSSCGNCHATWPVTGTATYNVLQYLHTLKGCGPLVCRWKVAKKAAAEPYMVIQFTISPRPPTGNGPSTISGYAGIRSTYKYEYVR